jgi:hypothetical protein
MTPLPESPLASSTETIQQLLQQFVPDPETFEDLTGPKIITGIGNVAIFHEGQKVTLSITCNGLPVEIANITIRGGVKYSVDFLGGFSVSETPVSIPAQNTQRSLFSDKGATSAPLTILGVPIIREGESVIPEDEVIELSMDIVGAANVPEMAGAQALEYVEGVLESATAEDLKEGNLTNRILAQIGEIIAESQTSVAQTEAPQTEAPQTEAPHMEAESFQIEAEALQKEAKALPPLAPAELPLTTKSLVKAELLVAAGDNGTKEFLPVEDLHQAETRVYPEVLQPAEIQVPAEVLQLAETQVPVEVLPLAETQVSAETTMISPQELEHLPSIVQRAIDLIAKSLGVKFARKVIGEVRNGDFHSIHSIIGDAVERLLGQFGPQPGRNQTPPQPGSNQFRPATPRAMPQPTLQPTSMPI